MDAQAPSFALKLFVYFAWGASCLSMIIALAVRASHRLVRWLEKRGMAPWSFATSALIVGTYLLILSQEMSGIVKYDGNVPIIDSMLNTIRMFGARGGNSIQQQVLALYLPPKLVSVYETTHSLARLAAPVDTLMGIFILLSNFISSPQLFVLSPLRDTYIFSKLTDQSLMVATSIMNHYESSNLEGESKKCLVAFAGTGSQKGTGNNNTLLEKAISWHMLCIEKNIDAVVPTVRPSLRRRAFIISSDDELANLQTGINLVKSVTTREQKVLAKSHGKPYRRPEVHIMSTSPSADTFIDAASAEASLPSKNEKSPLVLVRRIDQMRGDIESFLWDYPLFLVEKPRPSAVPDKDSLMYTKTQRRIVIVGSGALVCEFLKAAVWCAQVDGIEFTIDLLDKGAESQRDKLSLDAPEVFRPGTEEAPSEYHINFVNCDPESIKYYGYLKDHRDDITYILIALGNDLTNVKVARRTREILEQGKYDEGKSPDRVGSPLICATISDKKLATAVGKMTSAKGAPYDIVPIGIAENTRSYDNLFMPEIDLMGRNVNRAYWGYYGMQDPNSSAAAQLRSQADDSYERSVYNRRSSRATAIHLKYNLFCYLRRAILASDNPQDVPAISTAQWQGELANFAPRGNATVPLASLVDAYQDYIDNSSADELRWLSMMEHDRWSAYVRTEGYEVADEQTFTAFFPVTKENQNRLSKQHVCLVPFEELQRTSDFVYPLSQKASDLDYEHLDDVIVTHLRDIALDRKRSE